MYRRPFGQAAQTGACARRRRPRADGRPRPASPRTSDHASRPRRGPQALSAWPPGTLHNTLSSSKRSPRAASRGGGGARWRPSQPHVTTGRRRRRRRTPPHSPRASTGRIHRRRRRLLHPPPTGRRPRRSGRPAGSAASSSRACVCSRRSRRCGIDADSTAVLIVCSTARAPHAYLRHVGEGALLAVDAPGRWRRPRASRGAASAHG